jgi:holin-like protein
VEIIKQFGIVFGICLIGQLISSCLPVAVPASVIGLILLLILLCLQIVKPHHIEKNSNFLLKNMAFFFIPAGVSILDNYRYVQGSIVPLLLVCLITTVLTFWAASRTVAATIKLQEKLRKKGNE